jgi:hypothetical protein
MLTRPGQKTTIMMMPVINDPCHLHTCSMQAAHVVPMPPVSECMRWQESVSDEFVRLMHSVLCTRKPICLFGTPLLYPVSKAIQTVRPVDMELQPCPFSWQNNERSVGDLGSTVIIPSGKGGQTL